MYMLVMNIICPTLQRGCFLCDVHGILQFTMQERPKPTSKAAAAAQQIGGLPQSTARRQRTDWEQQFQADALHCCPIGEEEWRRRS